MNPTLLDVENVSISFGGICALSDISFKVDAGKITSIIGPNGAGKTTLFNCITGFYKVDSGAIQFNTTERSIDIKQQLGAAFLLSDLVFLNRGIKKIFYHAFGGSHRLARIGIARTFQNLRLFSEMTVLENILIAQHMHLNRSFISGILNTAAFKEKQNAALERAKYWLGMLQLDNKANTLANQLSYGQRKKLEIARALATEPKLICLDEPAAGLNSQEVEGLQDFIGKICSEHQITILLIEHHMELVMNLSHHILVLNAGKVIAEGSPNAIQNNADVITAYLGSKPNE